MTQNLEDLLKQMKTSSAAQPGPVFAVNTRIRVLNQLKNVRPVHISRRHSFSYHIVRFAGGGLLAASLLGGTLVYAAQYSTPGSPLYPVKTASEQAALLLAPTEQLKTNVATAVIDRRAAEATDMTLHGTTKEANQAVSSFRTTVSELEHTTGVNAQTINAHIEEHKNLLNHEGNTEDTKPPEHHESEGSAPLLLPTPAIATPTGGVTGTVQGAETEKRTKHIQNTFGGDE